MTDLIDQTRREITERIEQLRPTIDEYARLQAAAEALASISAAPSDDGATPAAPATPARRRAGRSRRTATRPVRTAARPTRAAAPKAATTRRRRGGRPKGSGTRGAEALKLIEGQPGITIREIAAKMKIAPNYLYRVLPPLEKEGKITKRGAGWQPAGGKS